MKYRKKPVVIEAVQYIPGFNQDEIRRWSGANYAPQNADNPEPTPPLEIKTMEGTMTAQPGDWIIKGVRGEFYPCKPDIFQATYESAEAPDAKA